MSATDVKPHLACATMRHTAPRVRSPGSPVPEQMAKAYVRSNCRVSSPSVLREKPHLGLDALVLDSLECRTCSGESPGVAGVEGGISLDQRPRSGGSRAKAVAKRRPARGREPIRFCSCLFAQLSLPCAASFLSLSQSQNTDELTRLADRCDGTKPMWLCETCICISFDAKTFAVRAGCRGKRFSRNPLLQLPHVEALDDWLVRLPAQRRSSCKSHPRILVQTTHRSAFRAWLRFPAREGKDAQRIWKEGCQHPRHLLDILHRHAHPGTTCRITD